ncbi:TIGR02281 family clan AA aspartic protease [Rhodobacteraceae bacterium NNCM2]|nr:TIGR02281 family clan AA aspartic protease [Coraliihabitans acroporae]
MFEAPDDTARLFYLSLLGIWIVAGVFFSYRNKLPTALRDAAAWVVIFVLAITAYGFKDTFLAQIYPGTAVMVSERSVALSRDRSGHFVANVEINGQPVKFLVDTGASDIVLSRKDAERVGLDQGKLAFLGDAMTANGTVKTAEVVLDSVKLGDFLDHDVRARVNGGDLFSSLLGISYLDRFRSWKVEGDKMVLTR